MAFVFALTFLLVQIYYIEGMCPDRWTQYQGSCYYLFEDKEEWTQAEMEASYLLLTLTMSMVLIAMTGAVKPYSVVCTSTKTAVISIDTERYQLSPPRGCLPTNQNGGNYTFGCLGDQNNHFLVSPVLESGKTLRGGKGSQAFSLSCSPKPDSDGRLVTLQAELHVVEDFTNENFEAPLTNVALLISSEDPSLASDPVTPMATSADLGQKLYLVIQSDQTIGESFFLPTTCSAKSEPPVLITAELWSDKINATRHCVQDTHLIEKFVVYQKGRRYPSSVNAHNLAFAPIYTFFLSDAEQEFVTYSCTVLVCPSTALSNSTCGKNLNTMASTNHCINLVDGSKPGNRRRRAVNDVTEAEFRTNTLSATIRIRDPSKASKKSELPIAAIVGGAAGGVVLVVIVSAVVLWRRMG